MTHIPEDDDKKLLRIRAEQWLASKGEKKITKMKTSEIAAFVHDLETHQIELEMQNEALREAQMQLSEARDQYSELYNQAPIGYLTTDQHGNITQCNLTLSMMLGEPRDKLNENLLSNFVFRDDQDNYYRHRVLMGKTQTPNSCELRLVKANGNKFWVCIDSVWVAGSDNKPWQLRSVVHDISGRRKAEANQNMLQRELRQSQKLQAIGILSGGIAHEFNNVLTPIIGFAEMIMADKPESAADYEYANMILGSATRAAGLIEQLLAYGRQSRSVREPLSLAACVEDATRFISSSLSSNIEIREEIAQGLAPILGMKNEIHQVILNLCINASHAMPHGGELTIGLTQSGHRRFTDSAGNLHEGQFQCLSLRDTGSGMDQETIDTCFDPFFTTKDVGQGTGLGLSVVQGIVAQLDGDIEVDSRVGVGTIFRIYLPLSEEAIKIVDAKTEHLRGGNETLLLIDDEPLVLRLVTRMLTKSGYKVVSYLDAEEALQHFATQGQNYDLVLTDYDMPKLNGNELAEQLNGIIPNIPIILMTGYGEFIDEQSRQSHSIAGVLKKPFKHQEITDLVRKALNTKAI